MAQTAALNEKWPGSLSTFAKTLVSGDDVVTWNSLMNKLRNTFDERCGWILRIFLPFGVLFPTIFGEASNGKGRRNFNSKCTESRRNMYQSFPNVGNLSQPGVFTVSRSATYSNQISGLCPRLRGHTHDTIQGVVRLCRFVCCFPFVGCLSQHLILQI